MYPLTKIVATLGPSSEDETAVRAMIKAGMNVARVNCSHGDWDTRKARIDLIRRLALEAGVPIAIMVDLQGPKIRTGIMPGDGIEISKDETIILVTKEENADTSASPKKVFIQNYPELPQEVKTGQRVLLDDGLLRLEVTEIGKDEVTTKVTLGGTLKSKKGVNLPESHQLSVKAITDKDQEDLKEAVKLGVDYIALSFVRHEQDIISLKDMIENQKPEAPIKIIAKIEKPQAVNHLDEILDVTDAVMVARGDLGVELEPEQVPIVQKKVIAEANRKNIIVITATQMMDSMMKNPFPTRAEVSDVANAIIDGTDAVMLSGETAAGPYPVEAVDYMRKIALEVESRAEIKREEFDPQFEKNNINRVAIARGVTGFAQSGYVSKIISFSCSGGSVQVISKFRQKVRIIAATTYQHTYNFLALVWGVTPIFFDQVDHTTTTIANLEDQLIKQGMIQEGETIIIAGGLPIAARSEANFIKLHTCNGTMRKQQDVRKIPRQDKALGPKIKKKALV